jgi:hypothetical protein
MSDKFNGIAMLVASSGRWVPIEWAFSLSSFTFPVGMSVVWFLGKADKERLANGEITRAMQREQLMEKALELGTEYIMFLDDDTVSPAWAVQSLHRVLANNPEAGIAGGIYCTKEAEPQPLVFEELGAGPSYNWVVGDVFECKGLGTGCMMIKSSILKDIPKPWFYEPHHNPIGVEVEIAGNKIPIAKETGTDDLYFCKKVTEAGYKILAHGGVLPVHVGQDGTFHTLPLTCWPAMEFERRQEARRNALNTSGN